MIDIIPVEKNKTYIVKTDAVSSDGNGVAHIDGYTIFIPDSVSGDILKVLIVKTKSNYGYGKILEIITPSPVRIKPECKNAALCGGCCFMHIDYQMQLELKKDFINNAFSKIGGLKDFKVSEIIDMDNPFRYRNKMVFPFGKDKNGEIIYGFFRERSHDIIPLSDCILGDKNIFDILEAVKCHMVKYNIQPYDEYTHSGTVRRVFIRNSYHTKEIMVVISVNAVSLYRCDELIQSIRSVNPHIESIFLNINMQKNNLVLGDKNILIYKEPVITDYLCDIKFEISPDSFYQINPIQTEKLYKKAIELADISVSDEILDIYCGIGTISLAAAKYAKHVTGIEIVPRAVKNARKNAESNNIKNADFYSGDAQKLVPEFIKNGLKPDTVILDPPRKGSDRNTLDAILKAEPEKIIYISCNPATLARDMKILSEKYQPIKAVGVDMFPFTSHVETVVLMSRIKYQEVCGL